MADYAVVDISTYPNRFVLAVGSERGAQIFARRLGDQDGAPSLSYVPGGGFGLPDAARDLCDAARDPSLHVEISRELANERWANPDARPKWLAFRFENGAVCAYLEHDLPAVRRCAADPALVDVIEIYGEMPTGATLFDLWRSIPREARAAE